VGSVGVVVERLSKLADGGVHPLLGVDEHAGAPEPVDDLLARGHGSPLLHEQDEQLHGDTLEGHDAASDPPAECPW